MKMNLATKVSALLTVGMAQAVSEPIVPVVSISRHLIKSEPFTKWLKDKKEDMIAIREIAKNTSIPNKIGYFAGKLMGYGAYGVLGYGIYHISKNFG